MANRIEVEGSKNAIIRLANTYREALGQLEKDVMEYKNFILEAENLPEETNKGECLANVMLAYRHLEDARMRLGKVIQAADGGESIYDKKKEE